MYSALWRVLPGPVPVRVMILAILVAAVLFACVAWLFPWVAETFLQQEAVVEPSS